MVCDYTLTNEEYSALNKIIRGCRMDCWAIIGQTPSGNDYIHDIECGHHLNLREGLSVLGEGVCCSEHLEYCHLTLAEKEALKSLFKKFNISTDIFDKKGAL